MANTYDRMNACKGIDRKLIAAEFASGRHVVRNLLIRRDARSSSDVLGLHVHVVHATAERVD